MGVCNLFILYCVGAVQPGQMMNQTRRSIDFDPNDPLVDEAAKREGPPHPNFIIIGKTHVNAINSLGFCYVSFA
jgi:hypothetical protein